MITKTAGSLITIASVNVEHFDLMLLLHSCDGMGFESCMTKKGIAVRRNGTSLMMCSTQKPRRIADPNQMESRMRRGNYIAVSAAGAFMTIAIAVLPAQAQSGSGLKTVASKNDVATTISKLEAAIKTRGMKIFTRIDHAEAAKEAGLSMPPATVVIFGAPKGGTPNFLKKPTLAIDLPLKALVWQNKEGKVFVTYNSGAYVFGTIFGRHGLQPPQKVIKAQEGMLSGLANAAAN